MSKKKLAVGKKLAKKTPEKFLKQLQENCIYNYKKLYI